MKIIVSFTTIPSRIKFIEPVIQSILNQTENVDEIHLQLPKYSLKEKVVYEIPSFLSKYPEVIIKNNASDMGSATKWFFPLQYLKNEKDTWLFIIDDDMHYRKDSIEFLCNRINKDETKSYAYTGGIIPKLPEIYRRFIIAEMPQPDSLTIIENNSLDIPVDTIQGFSMYCIKPYWFKTFDFQFLEEKSFLLCDDTLISSLLVYLGIARIQVGPYKLPNELKQSKINPIHGSGRLILRSMQTLEFVQKSLGIWKDVRVEYPKKPSIFKRMLRFPYKIFLKIIKKLIPRF